MLTGGRAQRGVTLVELMIASVVALIALAALITAYSATAGHSSQYLHGAHLHQQLNSVLHIMGNDIRRAGYWGFDPALHSAEDNPFTESPNRLRTGSFAGEAPDSCILFAYDLDNDGLVGVGDCQRKACRALTDSDNVEQFGYRLRDGRIQARYGGEAVDCESGHWQALTDPDIEISNLVFTLHSMCLNLDDTDADCAPQAPGLIRQAVAIQVNGRTRAEPQAMLTLASVVRVRNDRLVAGAN